MAIENCQLQLEEHAHNYFRAQWRKGVFQGQRYGQAFYDYFNLSRLQNQEQLMGLYEADGDKAIDIIKQVFNFN